MDNTRFAALFPLGSHLCRQPMPLMTELKHDMELLKHRGFNLIKLQEHWMYDEPLEEQFDFSPYEELVEYAARLDLGVYLGLTCEQAPGWLYRKHPECRMVKKDGVPVAYEAQSTLPADGKPGPCFDHPGAVAEMTRFITRLVQTLGKYENIVVWNTWQEVGYWSTGLVGGEVCYCEHTLNAFRSWLGEKYRDLDGLNRAWRTRYGDWLSVQPDRVLQPTGQAMEVDWKYFMDNVQIAGVLKARAEAIRAVDPRHRPVFAHKGAAAIASGQDWMYARCQDFLGSSSYPAWSPFHAWDDANPRHGEPQKHAALLAEMYGVALNFDIIRSANQFGSPVWAAEFQGGPVSTGMHKGRVPSPEDIRRWMLTAVGSGVNAISFWVTRAEIAAGETNGFSLLDSTGDTTPRLEEAGRVGRALNRHADLFGSASWGGSEVGILVNEWNKLCCSTINDLSDHLSYSTRGWHRLLWEAGIPVDFVDIGYADEQTLGKYKVLVLPVPFSISEILAEKLAGYVEGGGHLISEATPGRLDEHAFANRGEVSPAMARLFGVSHRSIQMVSEPGAPARWMPRQRTWGEFLPPTMLAGVGELAGDGLRANVYLETYNCLDSQPILTYQGETAGTVRRFGVGTAWLLGTYLGHSGMAYCDEANTRLVRNLLAQCGVKPVHTGLLALRRRIIPGKTAVLLTNLTPEEVTETLDIATVQVQDLLDEPFEWHDQQVTLTVKSLDVRVLIISI